MSERRNVVIIGAGVIGMTTAHVLSTRFPGRFNITLVARDMPEDLTSQGFSSPWAVRARKCSRHAADTMDNRVQTGPHSDMMRSPTRGNCLHCKYVLFGDKCII